MAGQANFSGKNKIFFNEVKDLAHYVRATLSRNYLKN